MLMPQNMRAFQTVLQHQPFVVEQFKHRPVRHHRAAVEHDGARTQFHHQFQVVGGNQFGGGNVPEQRLEFPPAARVEIARRFIQDQDCRLTRQHTRQTDAALLAVTQVVRGPVTKTGQSNLGQ